MLNYDLTEINLPFDERPMYPTVRATDDEDVRPSVDAEIWYEGEDKAEALRIAAKYASDCGKGDTGVLEICKRGISRQIFEVAQAHDMTAAEPLDR